MGTKLAPITTSLNGGFLYLAVGIYGYKNKRYKLINRWFILYGCERFINTVARFFAKGPAALFSEKTPFLEGC
ncbi:MAG: hypothetical protein IIA62_10860 [Nitrospinae bacterium]|nr:hypothetical protein [Nitrospinota bacterium]